MLGELMCHLTGFLGIPFEVIFLLTVYCGLLLDGLLMVLG